MGVIAVGNLKSSGDSGKAGPLINYVLGLSPYEHDDALVLLARVAGRYGENLPAQTSERLIELTGGHPGLLKATCLALIQGKAILPENDEDAIAALLQVDDVRTECGKLWNGIDQEERNALRGIVINQEIALRNIEVARRLRLKYLTRERNGTLQPICALFAKYIAEQNASSSYPTKIQAGPIRIDTAGEVWVGDQQLIPTPTKKELLLLEYLCLEPGRLRTRDEIVAVVYPEEYQAGNSPSDDALNALVKRLREGLDKAAQCGNVIATLRGKGYRLAIN